MSSDEASTAAGRSQPRDAQICASTAPAWTTDAVAPGPRFNAVLRPCPTLALAKDDPQIATPDALPLAVAKAIAPALAVAKGEPPLANANALSPALTAELRAHGQLFEEIADDDTSRHWSWVQVLLVLWKRAKRANPKLTEAAFGQEIAGEPCLRRRRRKRAPPVPRGLAGERTAAPDDEESAAYSGPWICQKLATALKWAWPPQTEAESWEFMRDFHGHSKRKRVADQTPEERRRDLLRAVERDARKARELGCSSEEIYCRVDAGIRSALDRSTTPKAAKRVASAPRGGRPHRAIHPAPQPGANPQSPISNPQLPAGAARAVPSVVNDPVRNDS